MGTLSIAGRTFTVTQAGCTLSLAPISRSVPVAGISNAMTGVSATAGCAWTAASNDPVDHPHVEPERTWQCPGRLLGGVELREYLRSNGDAHHRRPDLHRDPGRLHVLAGSLRPLVSGRRHCKRRDGRERPRGLRLDGGQQ